MRHNTFSRLVLLSALAGGVWLWGTGCNFSQVEGPEGIADESLAPINALLEPLAAADTPTRAEPAIRAALDKTGLSQAGPFGQYALSDEEVAALAETHARFVSREAGAGTSLQASYDRLIESGQVMETDLGETLELLSELANYALAEPEDPENTMLLLASTDSAAVPNFFVAPPATQALSPLRSVFFETLLRHRGPTLREYVGRKRILLSVGDCNTYPCTNRGTRVLVCHKPGTPAEKTLCLPRAAVPGHLGHGDQCGDCELHDQGGG